MPACGRSTFSRETSNLPGIVSLYDGKNPDLLLAGYHGEPLCLVLGNSPNGHSSWKGDLLGLAFYDRVLTADQVSADFLAWQTGKPAVIADTL